MAAIRAGWSRRSYDQQSAAPRTGTTILTRRSWWPDVGEPCRASQCWPIALSGSLTDELRAEHS
ncbi:hypothetical protein [Actinomadura oligospora]|uniref:hypothetical protein n=1 Tax=Actinomadura oligospora TaxID=111804 RepID=UPI0012FBF8CE|nr:hypothetical protein [Actinomadura oligospora]